MQLEKIIEETRAEMIDYIRFLRNIELVDDFEENRRLIFDAVKQKKRVLVITSCSKSKQQKNNIPASELYLGQFFLGVKAFAKKIKADLAILSANYGLIRDSTIVSYYEKRINEIKGEDKPIFARKVAEQFSKVNINYDVFIVLMGNDYKAILMPCLDLPKSIIFFDSRGIGGYNQIITRLNQNLNKTLFIDAKHLNMTEISVFHTTIKVILTNPHGFCTYTLPRNCDLLSSAFMDSIQIELTRLGVDSNSLSTDFRREWGDANRRASRATAFRKEIDEVLASLDPNLTIVLDIHSAPSDALEEHGIHNFEVYLLDMADFTEDDEFNQSLFKYLSDKGILTFKLKGSIENDIIFKAISFFGIKKASLIEINESISIDRRGVIARNIAEYIKQTNVSLHRKKPAVVQDGMTPKNLLLSMIRNRLNFQENDATIESKFQTCASLSDEVQEVCADSIIKEGKPIGSGEFSDAYLVNGLVVKKNRDRSKYNPPNDPTNYDPSKFLRISKKEMEGEIKIYKAVVEKGLGKFLPKYMLGFELNSRYYIIREYGFVYLQPGQNEWVTYPKWQTGVISQENFNNFCDNIFLIGKELEGTWFDSLQIGQRESGDIFLVDLGHFLHRAEWEERGDDDYKQIAVYDRIIMNLLRLGEQLTLHVPCPEFISDFYLLYYNNRVNESSPGSVSFYEKTIEIWENIKKTKTLDDRAR